MRPLANKSEKVSGKRKISEKQEILVESREIS
jgi:hypothetical protein